MRIERQSLFGTSKLPVMFLQISPQLNYHSCSYILLYENNQIRISFKNKSEKILIFTKITCSLVAPNNHVNNVSVIPYNKINFNRICEVHII